MTCLKCNKRRGMMAPARHFLQRTGPFSCISINFVDMITPVQGKQFMLVVVGRSSSVNGYRECQQSIQVKLVTERSAHALVYLLRCQWKETMTCVLQKLWIRQNMGSRYCCYTCSWGNSDWIFALLLYFSKEGHQTAVRSIQPSSRP